jgi:hypothetical protein
MDKTTMGFLALLAVLFLGQVIMTESFYDASADASGNLIISISDLLSLLGSSTTTPGPTPGPTSLTTSPSMHEASYSTMRDEIMGDVKSAVRNELLNSQWTGLLNSGHTQVLDDSCIDTFAAQQGSDFMRYIPGKNPDDYIRKDSVPCYGCSIP